MKALGIIDTSVFCELLAIPVLCRDPVAFKRDWMQRIKNGERFLVPLATVIETGNHIGHISSGGLRRSAADRFIKDLRVSLAGNAPYVIAPDVSRETLSAWCESFAEWSVTGSGLGDLAIKLVWDQMCARLCEHRVYIWSLDQHLSQYDTGPRGP